MRPSWGKGRDGFGCPEQAVRGLAGTRSSGPEAWWDIGHSWNQWSRCPNAGGCASVSLPSAGDTPGSSLLPSIPHLPGNLLVTQGRVTAHRSGGPSNFLEENLSLVWRHVCKPALCWKSRAGFLTAAFKTGRTSWRDPRDPRRREGPGLEVRACLGGTSLFL